jgi:hypothetical protein
MSKIGATATLLGIFGGMAVAGYIAEHGVPDLPGLLGAGLLKRVGLASPDFNVTFQPHANGSSMTVIEVQLMDREPAAVEKFVVNGSKDCRLMTADPTKVFSGMAPVLDALRQERNPTKASPQAPASQPDVLKMGERRRIVSVNCEPVQIEIVTDRGTSAYGIRR